MSLCHWWQRHSCLCFCFLSTGCAPYTQLKIDLVDESRRGLAFVQQSMDQRQQLLEQLQQSRRVQLDQAFDADARAKQPLTASWVIDARKAYAVGVDALHGQSDASKRAHETAAANLVEVDRALQQLQLLQQIERRLSIPGVKP